MWLTESTVTLSAPPSAVVPSWSLVSSGGQDIAGRNYLPGFHHSVVQPSPSPAVRIPPPAS